MAPSAGVLVETDRTASALFLPYKRRGLRLFQGAAAGTAYAIKSMLHFKPD